MSEKICNTCKHWGGQGVIGTKKTTEGDERVCMAYLFYDIDNNDFRPIPDWVVTYGSLSGAKGVLKTHRTFGCINYNNGFD